MSFDVFVLSFGGWGGWMFVFYISVWQNGGGGVSKLARSMGRVVGRLQMFVPWGMVAYSGSYRYAGRIWTNKKHWW